MQILASGSYERASYILYYLFLSVLKTKQTKITDQILKGLLYEIHLLVDWVTETPKIANGPKA